MAFLDDDFLLDNDLAKRLYHECAEAMPIFDYHSHLSAKDIRENRNYENLAQIWLNGDHYKWRAMRAAGIPENRITGDVPDRERFQAWAETVPKTIGNPLYVWTHLELRRYFGITDLLDPSTAGNVYDRTSEQLLGKDFSVQALLSKMKVRVLCTTDDPLDALEDHRALAEDQTCAVKVLPTFRPDKALNYGDTEKLNAYLDRLSDVSGIEIANFSSYLAALEKRHDFFHERGCRISDHGMTELGFQDWKAGEVDKAFQKVRSGASSNPDEIRMLTTAALRELARMDKERGWSMQLHFGALRNTNRRLFGRLGPDSGFDAIHDAPVSEALSLILDDLTNADALPRTILYPLNPKDYAATAALAACFQGDGIPGKIQFGPAWWFNDQRAGMEEQLRVLANQGLLSSFVGMTTDSRSFLSFPRHEYFRRILCRLLGDWAKAGEVPDDFSLLGGLVRDLCFNNAERNFSI